MRILHRRCLVSLLCMTAVMAPAAGRAKEPESQAAATLVAVLAPEFSKHVSEGARATLLQRLVEGLKVARFEVLAGKTLLGRLGDDAGAAACRSPECFPGLAGRLRVAYLVVAKVRQVDRNYDISLKLVRGRSGEDAAELHERCDICGIEEAGEKMGLAASSLRAKLEALMVGPARLAVRSTPAAAYVYIDGEEVGQTPLEREVPGGPHTLRLRHRGYIAAERTVTLVPEVAESVDVTLIRAADTFPYKKVGWSAVGVGAAVIIGGVVAVAVDGTEISCSADEVDGRGHCPYVRDTRTLGAVLTALGAAAATTGGLLLWLGMDKGVEQAAPAAAGPSVSLVPGGAAMTWSGAFW